MTPPRRHVFADEPHSGKLGAVTAITATYVYFLLFAQFAFLDVVQARFADPAQVKAVMAAMGLAGIGASLLTAWLLGRVDGRRLLLLGFSGSGLTAVLALLADGSAAPLPVFAALGASIGAAAAILTVSLAASLGLLLGGPAEEPADKPAKTRFATFVGLGTGLAYLICNVPALFEGSVAVRCLFAAAVCAAGLVAVWRNPSAKGIGTRPSVAGPEPRAWGRAGASGSRRDYRGLGFATIVLSFVALIWLDSAAFAVIQETPALKAATWGSGAQKLAIGVAHLLGAVVAGWLIDRGRLRSLLVATFALFAVSFAWLEAGTTGAGLASAFYAIGIAVYSTALVAFPARRGEEPGLVPVRWRAGLLFGIAGWLGSALGVGMAQSLHRIPSAFVWLAGSLVVLSWALSARSRAADQPARLERTKTFVRLFGWSIALAVLPFTLLFHREDPAQSAATLPATVRGRAVYIREGCINCHSQYVRPGGHDVELWGPYRPVQANEKPPLLGNRRLGPDLRNVGNRRSGAWQRVHLENPRALVPESRMPQYAHLFKEGTTDGDDLVAYLSGLGRETALDRYEITQSVAMAVVRNPGVSQSKGRDLFGEYCAPCHGADARGSGPLAASVYKERSAIDLTKRNFWLVPWGAGAESEDKALARVVKFGIANTSMPGHEYLSDRQIANVVSFVQAIRADATLARGDGGSADETPSRKTRSLEAAG